MAGVESVEDARPRRVFAMSLVSGIASAVRRLIDVVLPHRCTLCGVIVQGEGGFCPDCWLTLDFLGEPACHCCFLPFETMQGEGALCGGCMAEQPPFAMARAPLAYGTGSRELIIGLKYGRRIGNARVMARMLQLPARAVIDADTDGLPVVLVPVPLHRWRLWWRGFNQSALLAQHLANAIDVPLLIDGLIRRKPTASMRGLGRKARKRAVRGAFAIHPARKPAIRGAHVILIDDVLTTGATAHACARIVKRGGAARVSLISFARVVDGRGAHAH